MQIELGQTVMTQGVNNYIEKREISMEELIRLLSRHASGDWGEVCEEDAQANNDAVENGDRILSAYYFRDKKVWIITDAEVNGARNQTTVLFPEEY